jgi:multidrug efflux pump subunit AcrB
MNLAKFSIKQKVLVNLITFAAIIVGIFVTANMQREAMPNVEIDYVAISTIYPGASPYEVEKLITIPIEDALENIDGIESYNSGSRESSSFLFVELEPDLANRDKVINEIAREVDKVDLPDDAEDPEVEELVIEHSLIEVAFTGKDMPEEELRQHVLNFEEILKNIKGVGSVDRVGWRDKEISIEVDPDNLEKYYISLAQVIQCIRNQNVNLPGGKLKSGSKEMIIRTVGEIDNAKGFEDIIIRTNSDGKYLYIKDVAQAKETFEEQTQIYKTNGHVSINLIPKKKKSGDTIKIVDQIKKEVATYQKTLPENVSIALLNDMAFYVKRRLNVLTSNGTIGLVLLVITLLMFLNVRIALVTAMGIPFAFLTALIFMSFFGVSLNLLTMFGLIIVLGMIVDDAIVVSENVYRHMEEGMPVKEAVITGAHEVAAPVTATILTTTAAFLPLMFTAGIMGKFLRFFPMGVIFALGASLFEALIILPSHLAEWVRPLKAASELEVQQELPMKDKSLFAKIMLFPISTAATVKHYLFSHERKGSEAKWFQNLLNGYTAILKFSVRKRYLMGFCAFLMLVGAVVFSVKIMPFKLFPDMIEMFYARIEAPEGTSLEQTNKMLMEVEEEILKLPGEELENVTGIVGYIGDFDGGGINQKWGGQYAQCVIYLTPEQKRERDADEIISKLRSTIENKNIPGVVSLSFEKVQNGPPVGKPVAVQVRGDNYETLLKLTREVQSFMGTIDGVEDIKDNYELDKEEIQVTIDKKEAARLGLNVLQIAGTIRYAFEGGLATTVRKEGEDVEVLVRLPEKDKNRISTLRQLTIPNNSGRLIKLFKVANFDNKQGIKNLSHEFGKRTITITASVDENKITPVAANMRIKKKFARLLF